MIVSHSKTTWATALHLDSKHFRAMRICEVIGRPLFPDCNGAPLKGNPNFPLTVLPFAGSVRDGTYNPANWILLAANVGSSEAAT